MGAGGLTKINGYPDDRLSWHLGNSLIVSSGAAFSLCKRWRYRLWRHWIGKGNGKVTFVMMNPSTADEINNDPTVERCVRRVQEWNLAGICDASMVEVVNVFAWRETDSRLLKTRIKDGFDIVGTHNDESILHACRGAEMVVCAWGNPGNLLYRGARVLQMLRDNDITPMALNTNKDGTPQHPLYIGYDVVPFPI